MRARPLVIAVVLALSGLGAPDGVGGQDGVARVHSLFGSCPLTEEQCEFLHSSRRATERYHSTASAMADGFRPVGADAPAMGRHWFNLTRLFDGRIDAEKPEVLTYAVVEGREILVGVGFAYIVGLRGGAAPPKNPFEPGPWHIHSGTIDLESHRIDHVGGGLQGSDSASHGRDPRPGVSLLHAWLWVDNPVGLLEPNNWNLPYFRLGLSRPPGATIDTDRAVSLASSGAEFFMERAELFAEPDSRPTTTEALRVAATEVDEWWRGRLPGPLTADEVEWLGNLWRHIEPAES